MYTYVAGDGTQSLAYVRQALSPELHPAQLLIFPIFLMNFSSAAKFDLQEVFAERLFRPFCGRMK